MISAHMSLAVMRPEFPVIQTGRYLDDSVPEVSGLGLSVEG